MADTRRRFWPTVTSSPWAWTCLAVFGIGGSVAGAYFSWGYHRGGTAAVTALSTAGGLVAALIVIFLALLFGSPFRALGDDLRGLSDRVATIEGAAVAGRGPDHVRIALFAVRTELAACGVRLQEALTRRRWWNPELDPLPTGKWTEHVAGLSDPSVPTALHVQMELAYQHCDRLNHRIRRYIQEYRDSHFQVFPMIPASIWDFQADDEQAMRDVEHEIRAANTSISQYVDGAQG